MVDEKKIQTRRTTVELIATDAHPSVLKGELKEGEKFKIHVAHEEKMRNNKWGVDESVSTKTKGAAVPLSHDPAANEELEALRRENAELKEKASKK